jgi:hypothetical protein
MINLKNIVVSNDATFYDYRTGGPLPRRTRVAFKLLLVVALVALFPKVDSDFIDNVLTIYAILIGFSFNILFFLLSVTKKEKITTNFLEDQNKAKKIHKLGKELFHNVSYFNLVSISLILIAITYNLCKGYETEILSYVSKYVSDEYSKSLRCVAFYTQNTIFYALLVESTYTFIRTLSRVSFYFDKKIKFEENLSEK